MNKKINKIILSLLLVLLIQVPVFAIDSYNYSDFSSRSLIINRKNNFLTQEQKDILLSKKLVPTVKCLIEQIKRKNIENVEILLDCRVDPNYNYLTEYPMYIAAKNNDYEIVKLLYKYGAKLDRGFYSELYEAVKNKNSDMALFLIKNNANINYKDSVTDNTILYYTLKNNLNEVLDELIKRNVRIDIKSIKLIKKKKLYNLINQTK